MPLTVIHLVNKAGNGENIPPHCRSHFPNVLTLVSMAAYEKGLFVLFQRCADRICGPSDTPLLFGLDVYLPPPLISFTEGFIIALQKYSPVLPDIHQTLTSTDCYLLSPRNQIVTPAHVSFIVMGPCTYKSARGYVVLLLKINGIFLRGPVVIIHHARSFTCIWQIPSAVNCHSDLWQWSDWINGQIFIYLFMQQERVNGKPSWVRWLAVSIGTSVFSAYLPNWLFALCLSGQPRIRTMPPKEKRIAATIFCQPEDGLIGVLGTQQCKLWFPVILLPLEIFTKD